jgi:hypothetical protein
MQKQYKLGNKLYKYAHNKANPIFFLILCTAICMGGLFSDSIVSKVSANNQQSQIVSLYIDTPIIVEGERLKLSFNNPSNSPRKGELLIRIISDINRKSDCTKIFSDVPSNTRRTVKLTAPSGSKGYHKVYYSWISQVTSNPVENVICNQTPEELNRLKNVKFVGYRVLPNVKVKKL